MTTLIRTLLIAAWAVVVCEPTAAAIYAVTRGEDSVLYRIDPDQSSIEMVGATGVDHLTGLAYVPARRTLVAHQPYDSFNPNERAGRLYQIDPQSGVATLMSEDGLSISDLATDSSGQLFGWMENHNPAVSGLPTTTLDQLVLLDLDAGPPKYFDTIGRPSFSARSGLAFRTDGTLVLKSATDPSQPGGDFFLIDHATGAVSTDSPIGSYQGISHNVLAFDQNDVAHTIDRSDNSTSILQTIDLGTGSVSNRFDTGVAGIAAITFVESTDVPEPSAPLGLIVGCLVLARRRRVGR